MRYLKRRGPRAAYDVTGNVLWLTRRPDPITALKQSIARLADEIARSGRLKADIAAAIGVRRYELYRRSAALGSRASERTLAAAQGTHVECLLKFVHAIAAAGAESRAGKREPAAPLDPLAKSIRELEASVERAQRLSKGMLRHCQTRDCRGGASPPSRPRH